MAVTGFSARSRHLCTSRSVIAPAALASPYARAGCLGREWWKDPTGVDGIAYCVSASAGEERRRPAAPSGPGCGWGSIAQDLWIGRGHMRFG